MGYPRSHCASRWSGLATGRMLLYLWLMAVCVLALPRAGYAQALTTLYSFTNGSDGAGPQAGLIQADDGNFYGTTAGGGAKGWGTVFKITMGGVLTTLYSFQGGSDGGNPYAGVIQASDGNLYGTTWAGGTAQAGTVFKVTMGGVLTTLYSFTGGSDGANPWAGLIEASDGNLYGTTSMGGIVGVNAGTVFRITLSGTLTTLCSFYGLGGAFVGGAPEAGLIQADDGNLYGTTAAGGIGDLGTVFRITLSGTFTTLHKFVGNSDGEAPKAGLIQASDGNLYGTTSNTVFRMTPSGSLTTLHAFTYGSDGAVPRAGLIQADDGNFYGTTGGDGIVTFGTVFRLTADGVLSTLYTFTNGSDGGTPWAGLIQASDSNLYGTTVYGGAKGLGTVFRINLFTLTSLSPNTAMPGGPAFTLTVNGTGFLPGATVSWNNTLLPTTVVSNTQLTAPVPAAYIASAGTARITAANPGRTASNALFFSFLKPAPSLTSMTPNSATVGGPAFTLTVNGSGFVSGASVKWNGSPLATTFVSSTQLSASVPALDLLSAQTVSVTAANPRSYVSNALTFTINNTAPSLTSLSPNSTAAGGAAFTLTVTGSGFVSGATASWNGTALRTIFVSATKVHASVPAANIASAGTASVTAANPGTAPSNALTFTINAPLPPSLTSLSPNSATAGGPAFTLTVTGSGFVSGATLNWNGATLTTTFVSSTHITSAIPAADIATAATVNVTCANPGSAASNALPFTINNPKPVLTSISPSSAFHGSGPVTITLNGDNFVAGSQVQWIFGGTTTVLSSSFISPLQLTATVPSDLLAMAGTATVQVSNPTPGGGTSAGKPFTIH